MMNIELKTAAAYIRVSTDKQTELSPDSQIKEVRKYAKQHGYIVPDEYIFRDDGISGRKAENRPDFIRMIATSKQSPLRSQLFYCGNSVDSREIWKKAYFIKIC